MKVLITGGTGFVGSHTCRQLLAAGHNVRLLVRDIVRARALYPARVDAALEFVRGDVTDSASVVDALASCDAVVHSAAATPMQAESAERLLAVNAGGVENVVGGALAQGIRRIVCLSSITAIFDPDGDKVTPDAPPRPSRLPYGRSKVAADLYLRRLQAQGAPVAVLYPGGVIGPDDPGCSDACKALKHRIENGFRIFGDGGMQYVDVRDLAAFICSLVIEGGSGRFLLPGVYSTWVEQADIIESVSGCRLQRIAARGWWLRLIGQLLDAVRIIVPVDSPVSAETMRYATLWPRIANTEELAARGLALRDPMLTLEDTLRWMVAAGHLEPQACPKFDAPAPHPAARMELGVPRDGY